MFGSSTNTPFGSSTGASFGTGTSTTFGSSLFGGSTNRDNGLFGSGLLGASGTTLKGTPVKFSVVHKMDSIVKNGITTNITAGHQCITVMPIYDKKSIEELRIEDYEAGRKKEIFSICKSSGSLFGNTSDSGCSTSSSLTGAQSTTGFGVAVGSGLTHCSPAPTATPVAPGFISVGSLATNATSTAPLTEGLTLGITSAPTGLSNTGFTMGEAQPTGLSASMFGIPNTQVGGFTFGSAPSQGFTLGAGKTTASASVNPTTAFTFGGATTPASSASSGFTLGNGSVGGNPTSGLTLGATSVTTTTGGLSLGGGLKLGGIAASSANAGTTGTSTAPRFSFPPASGVKLGTTQTTSLPTGTTTGSLFGSTSKTAGLFGQQQTTEGLGQRAGSLFGTPTSTGTRFGSGFSTTTSIFGQSSCGQTTGLSVATTTSAGLSFTVQTQAVKNPKIKAAKRKGRRLAFGQTGVQSDQTLFIVTQKLKDHQETTCKTEAIGSTGLSCLSTSTSKGGVFGNTSGTGFDTSSSLIGQEPSTGFGTTGSLSGSSSKPATLFGQQQTTEGLGQKPDVLFNTTTSTTETGIKLGSTTSSTSGLATSLSFSKTTSAELRLPETKSTDIDCGRAQSETGELLEEQQDDPPSLSPRFSLSEAMSEGMEELRKENESLRKVIKMYKENEKAMEELRRFYTAQATKHKENMEQAVSHKFLELVSKVRGLKTIRDTTPDDGKTSVVIREAIDLTRNNRIDLESLKSLQQVQECESALQQAQECVRQYTDKEELLAADIVIQRDKARKELFDPIDLFCQEVELIPLQERENSLQHALSQLQEQEDALDSCGADPDLEEAVEAYEEWMQRSRQEVIDVKHRVNQCTEDLTTALSRLELALKVSQDSSEAGSIPAPFGDLDAMISSLSSAIQEEMDKCQVSEDEEAKQKVDCAIKALITELKREMADNQELRDNLVPKYKSLQTDMSPWLDSKPDLKNVEDVRATIESLRLRLCERLADKKDLEEVESDISDIYLQLHKSFEDESNFMEELAKFTSEHFPELPIAHPEVGISEYLASNGLVKPGRELEHYPHYDSVPSVSHDNCSVIKTEFAGKPCILKELDVDRELGGIETLQRKAVEYHSVDCPFLMPLDAFFVTGSRAFVQMPLLISGEEWLTSHECSSEAITLVLRDILDALNSLHLKNICHGSVHLQSVFVEKRCGEYRGVLDFFPFTNSQCIQTEDMKLFGDLIVKMNFPNKDTTTTISQLTEDTDLLAVLGDLLDTDDVDRLTAQQTLQQAYFCKCV